MKNLENTYQDHLVSAAKGLVSICPFIGPLAAEAIGSLIPNQRLDRIVEFVKYLEAEVCRHNTCFENIEKNIQGAEGLDLMEEGLIQAARSVSRVRKERLARLVGRSLTSNEVKYEEARKLLNLYHELTDPEIVWLIFFSLKPGVGAGPHQDFFENHREVLMPISRVSSAPSEQRDRIALEDSYKNTLMRFGLIEMQGKSPKITSLGRLLVRYIDESEPFEGNP